MARDVFHMVITKGVIEPDLADEVLHPLDGISVAVYLRGTTTVVPIYQRPTGSTQGPTPESGAIGTTNPFTTGVTGDIEFWCDGPKELDIYINDPSLPARITARTIGWNCMPAANGSLSSAILAADAGLTLAHLGADILRQFIQIGQVIDWWRPTLSVPVPSGFVICDGTLVPAGQHSFPGVAGSINVPDLRNMFILGADTAKTDGTGAGTTDAAASAPGIRGSGGSQQSTLDQTMIPAHQHPVNLTAAQDSSSDHIHAIKDSSGQFANFVTYAPSSAKPWFTAGAGSNQMDFDSDTNVPSGSHSHPVNGNTGNNPGTTGLPHNNVPRYYGLLKLMKVKWS